MRFRQKVAAFKRTEHSPVVTVSVLGNMTAKTASNYKYIYAEALTIAVLLSRFFRSIIERLTSLEMVNNHAELLRTTNMSGD